MPPSDAKAPAVREREASGRRGRRDRVGRQGATIDIPNGTACGADSVPSAATAVTT